MNSKVNLLPVFLLFCTVLIFSYQKDDQQAIDSLVREWNITAINTYLGAFTEGGSHSGLTVIEETGDLGTFIFGEEVVEYNFIQNSLPQQDIKTWKLTTNKENEGFLKVTKFTLDLEDTFVFDIAFGDQTNNSEKDATSATFFDDSNAVESGQAIEIFLEKK